jgi:hypothetical protein
MVNYIFLINVCDLQISAIVNKSFQVLFDAFQLPHPVLFPQENCVF